MFRLRIKGKIIRLHVDPAAMVADGLEVAAELREHLAAHDLTPADVIGALADLYPDLGVTIGAGGTGHHTPPPPHVGPRTSLPDAG